MAQEKVIGEIQKNARVYYEDSDNWYPTKKGLSLSKDKYKEVLELIEKAGKELEVEQSE